MQSLSLDLLTRHEVSAALWVKRDLSGKGTASQLQLVIGARRFVADGAGACCA